MIWLVSKLFGQFAPLFNFIGDHRWGGVALLLVIGAAAAWAYLPIVGAQTAKVLLIVAVGFATFDWGYSHRAAIDRETWRQTEAVRLAAELAEHARREDVIAKARDEAAADARRLATEEAARETILKESEHASHANDNRACLPVSGVMRLNRIR